MRVKLRCNILIFQVQPSSGPPDGGPEGVILKGLRPFTPLLLPKNELFLLSLTRMGAGAEPGVFNLLKKLPPFFYLINSSTKVIVIYKSAQGKKNPGLYYLPLSGHG